MYVLAVSPSPRTVLAMGVPSISIRGQNPPAVSKASVRGTQGFLGVSGSPSTWAGGPVRGKDWLPWSSRWTSAQSLPPFRTISSQLKGRQALHRLLAGAGVPSALSSQQARLPGLAPGAAEAGHTSQAGATGQSWRPDQAPVPGAPLGPAQPR